MSPLNAYEHTVMVRLSFGLEMQAEVLCLSYVHVLRGLVRFWNQTPDFKSIVLFATLLCSQLVMHHFTNI